MDIGPRLLVVREWAGDVHSELTSTSRGDRNVVGKKDEESSVITMNLRTSISSIDRNVVGKKDEESSVITMNLRTSISSIALLHMLTELIYFVLYMNRQMPCTYEELQDYCIDQTEAVSARSSNAGPSQHPRYRGRERREASNLKKLVKLKDEIEKLVAALQSCLSVLSDIRSVLFILGSSPTRPKQIYEVHLHCQVDDCGVNNEDQSRDQPKSSDLARKLIRALISDGATSSAESCMKLFLLVRASANSMSAPEDFHPKRGLVISKKQLARTCVRLVQQRPTNLEDEVSSISLSDPSPSTSHEEDSTESLSDDDYIWYQCQYTVKGLFEGNLSEAA